MCDSTPHPAHVDMRVGKAWPRLKYTYTVCLPDGCGFDELLLTNEKIISAITSVLEETGIVR